MVLSKTCEAFSDQAAAFVKDQYAEFAQYQLLAVETLEEVHRVCELNKIEYYLAFGSLLGAIRDGGQIPWDYDIDILVPYRFRDRLLTALERDLSDKYHYVTRFHDKSCRHYTIRVAPAGYDCAILHVDIFWLIGEDSDEKKQQEHFKIRRLYYQCMVHKHPNRAATDGWTRLTRIKRFVKYFKFHVIPEAAIEKKYLRLLEKPFEGSEFCTYNGRNFNLFQSKWFGTPQKYKTVYGSTFYIPEDYDSILKASYGDYMKTPKTERCLNEFMNSLDKLKKYAKL